jgi:hypothetical protein
VPAFTHLIDRRVGRPVGEWIFVRMVWLGMTLALLAYVARYGPSIPWQDDWSLIPPLTGVKPVTVRWLWEQMNEHRLPLVKLVLVAAGKVTRGDARVGMLIVALLLAGLALAMIVVAERLRGASSHCDAFFPMLVLHWGHHQNLLHQLQLFFVTAVAACMAVVLIAVDDRWRGRRGPLVGLGVALVLLPLSGAIGLAYAGPLLAWAAYAAYERWREGTVAGRRDAAALLASTAITGALGLLYLVGYQPNPHGVVSPSLTATLRSTGEVLSTALGLFGPRTWPVSAIGIVVAAVVSAGVVLAALRVAAERARAAGLLAGIVAVGALALASGHGRAGLGPLAGTAPRYNLLAAPLLFCAYYAWLVYGGRISRFVQVSLFALACASLTTNFELGHAFGVTRAQQATSLREDIRRGLPPEGVASRHYLEFYPWNEGLMASHLEMLRAAAMHPYESPALARLAPRECRKQLVMPLEPVAVNQMTFSQGVARGQGDDPYLVFALPSPVFVCAIRVELVLTNDHGRPAGIQAFWSLVGRGEFTETERTWRGKVAPSPRSQTLTIWIGARIDRFRIDPDSGPVDVRLLRMLAQYSDD